MGTRTVKSDSGNDLKLSNNGGTGSVTISDAGDLTIDSPADIILDAGGADITLKDGGTTYGSLKQSSGHLVIEPASNEEIVLNKHGGSTALTINTDGNTVIADGNRIQTDEVRAFDGAGLKLYDDDGNGIFIEDTGKVGIGVTNPSSFDSGAQALVVGTGNDAQGLTIYSQSNNFGNIYFADSTAAGDATRGGVNYDHANDAMLLRVNNANKFKIYNGGEVDMSFHGDTSSSGTTCYINASGRMGTSTSLREHKGNIKKIDINAVSLMEKFEPVTFNYKKYDTDTHSYLEELETGFEAGMIVDDIQNFAGDFNMLDADGNVIGIRYHLLIPYLIKSIQELSSKITALENA